MYNRIRSSKDTIGHIKTHNKEVLLKIKSELKDAPFKAIFDGSQKLPTHLVKKKIDTLMSEGE